jgi:hypothetical protein
LLSSITDQLYDHFAMSLDAVERKRSMVALKNLIMEIQLDPCVSMTREVKLAYGLVELLIPRITGGLNKVHLGRPLYVARRPLPLPSPVQPLVPVTSGLLD